MRPAFAFAAVSAAAVASWMLTACDETGSPTGSSPPTPSASQGEYRLATNDEPVDVARGTGLTGQVQLNENGCVVIGSSAVLWPKGYTVTTDEAGRVTVYNADGDPSVRVGDTIDVGVSRAPLDDPCASATNGFVMTEEPRVTS